MTNGAAAGASGAAAAAAIAQAVRAMGAIVQVEPQEFEKILKKATEPLIVCAKGGLFGTKYQYLSSYKGLIFYTKTETPVQLPQGAEVVPAKKIWIPG